MIDPALVLGGVAVVGLSPSAAILGLRHRDAGSWQAALEPYRLHLAGDIDPAGIDAFLSQLSGLLAHRVKRPVTTRGLVLEVVASEAGIEHYLHIDGPSREIVLSSLRSALPNVGVNHDPEYRPRTMTLAGELATARPDHQLRVDHPEVVSSALLASLLPLEPGESMAIVTSIFPLGHRDPPRRVSTGLLQIFLNQQSGKEAEPPKPVQVKFSLPQFGVTIRLGVASSSLQRDRQLLHRLTAAYHAANSEHAYLKRRAVTNRRAMRALAGRTVPLLGYPCRLNSSELLELLALPVTGVQALGLDLSGARQLAPSSIIARTGLIVADSSFGGTNRPLAISLRSAMTHIHTEGSTGSGKSTLLLSLFSQAVAAGYGCFALDPKVDFGTAALDVVPYDRDVAFLDPTSRFPIGIDLFAGSADDPELTAEQIVSTLHRIFLAFWGPRTDHYIRHGALSLAQIPGATFTDLPRLFVDPVYRRWDVAQLDEPIALGPFWAAYERMGEAERAASIGPILNKLAAVVARPRLRRVLGQSGATLDFDDVLATGKVVIAPLSAGSLGEDASALLGSFLLAKLWQSIQRRVRLDPAERKPFLVIVDEFQTVTNLASPLPEVLAQARAMGVGFALANQHLGQLDRETREAVLANCRTKIYFQTSASDARKLAPEFAPHLTARDLQGLAPFQAAMILAADGGVAPPITGRTRPAPTPLGFSEEHRQRSQAKYGRSAAEIDGELRRRYERPSGSGPVGRKRRSE